MPARWSLGLLLLTACQSLMPARPVLPLRTARLYETGVGYFERSGAVAGSTLPVPAGHLDDALKTLVVLAEDPRTAVEGITFPSNVSPGMARALAGFSAGDGQLSYRAVLTSLKGAAVRLSLRKGGTLGGRLIEVLGTEDPSLTLLLLGDDGKISRLGSAEIAEVQPSDPAVLARLGAAVNALAGRGAQSRRDLAIRQRGSRALTIGYIAESPVWRASYRLVMGASASTLQGWALVHNDTDEDWKEVRIHLVNGRPDSFLFPLAAPRYLRRQLVTPDEPLATVPQLLGKTVDEMWNDEESGEEAEGEGGLSGVETGASGGGYGRGAGGLGGRSAESESSEVTVGNLAAINRAAGVESGALFDYQLAAPLSLRAHESGLVPFVQEALEARPITISADGEEARAGVRLVNRSAQTLPAGPLACFADGSFAGEASLQRMKPGEVQFVTYGKDLDVLVTRKTERDESRPQSITRAEGDAVELHLLRTRALALQLENRAGRARTIHVRLDVGSNASITGADGVDFDLGTGTASAVFQLAPRSRRTPALQIAEGRSRSVALGALDQKQLEQLLSAEKLSAAQRQALAATRALVRQNQEEQAELVKLRQTQKEKEKDIDRLEKHLDASNGQNASAPRDNPFVQRLVKAEDEIERVRERIHRLEERRVSRAEEMRVALRPFER